MRASRHRAHSTVTGTAHSARERREISSHVTCFVRERRHPIAQTRSRPSLQTLSRFLFYDATHICSIGLAHLRCWPTCGPVPTGPCGMHALPGAVVCSTASRAYTAPTCRDTTPHHAAPVARRPRASARLALVDVGLLIFCELQLPRWHGTDARDLHVRMSYLVRCWLTCRVHIATDESSVAAHMEANIMACSIGESSRSYDVGLLTTGLLTGTCPTRYVAAIMSTSITPACVSIDCRQPITGLCSARPRQVRTTMVGRRASASNDATPPRGGLISRLLAAI